MSNQQLAINNNNDFQIMQCSLDRLTIKLKFLLIEHFNDVWIMVDSKATINLRCRDDEYTSINWKGDDNTALTVCDSNAALKLKLSRSPFSPSWYTFFSKTNFLSPYQVVEDIYGEVRGNWTKWKQSSHIVLRFIVEMLISSSNNKSK